MKLFDATFRGDRTIRGEITSEHHLILLAENETEGRERAERYIDRHFPPMWVPDHLGGLTQLAGTKANFVEIVELPNSAVIFNGKPDYAAE